MNIIKIISQIKCYVKTVLFASFQKSNRRKNWESDRLVVKKMIPNSCLCMFVGELKYILSLKSILLNHDFRRFLSCFWPSYLSNRGWKLSLFSQCLAAKPMRYQFSDSQNHLCMGGGQVEDGPIAGCPARGTAQNQRSNDNITFACLLQNRVFALHQLPFLRQAFFFTTGETGDFIQRNPTKRSRLLSGNRLLLILGRHCENDILYKRERLTPKRIRMRIAPRLNLEFFTNNAH